MARFCKHHSKVYGNHFITSFSSAWYELHTGLISHLYKLNLLAVFLKDSGLAGQNKIFTLESLIIRGKDM